MASLPEPEPRPPAPAGSTEESLRRLEQRLDRATEAAERLMAQAAAHAGGGGGDPADPGATRGAGDPDAKPGAGDPPSAGAPPKPPPAGWQIRGDDATGYPSPDLEPFIALLHAMRDVIPPDLQRRLVAAVREMLLALRALIDWYLERLERKREESVEVEDIPIL